MNSTPVLTVEEVYDLWRVKVPIDPAREGWVINVDAVLIALRTLDIKLPVRFRYTAGWRRVGGHRIKYQRVDDWPVALVFHGITFSQDRSLDSTNETLWHELAHARQAEYWARQTGKPIRHFYRQGYLKAQGPHGASYEENAYEIHANKVADLYRNTFYLAKYP